MAHQNDETDQPSTGSWLSRQTAGAAVAPLAILFGLNLVDEFDRVAFETLAPEIGHEFGLSITGITIIGIVSGLVLLILAIPMGVLADRYPRVRVAGASAILWGAMAALTGLLGFLLDDPLQFAPDGGRILAEPIAIFVFALFVARLLSGLGRLSNEVVHPSLLTDFYRPEAQPNVFRLHRLANPLGNVSAIVAGFVGREAGWEWAFILLSIPTFLLVLSLALLKEPERGSMGGLGYELENLPDDARAKARAGTRSGDGSGAGEIGSPAGSLESPDVEIVEGDDIDVDLRGLREGWSELFAIPSLRRFWLAAFGLGIATGPAGLLLSFFFEEVYQYDPVGRGMIQFFRGAGLAVGLLIGGRAAAKGIASNDYGLLGRAAAYGFWGWGAGFIGVAVMPISSLSALFVLLAWVGLGVYQPAYYTGVAQIVPAHVRTQAYSFAIVFAGGGSLFGIPLAYLAESIGYRQATAVAGALAAIAGTAAYGASRNIADDRDKMLADRAAAAAAAGRIPGTGD